MILEKATSRVNLQTVRMKLCPRWLRSKKVTQMTTRLISHPQAQEKGGDHRTSGRSPKKRKDAREVLSQSNRITLTAEMLPRKEPLCGLQLFRFSTIALVKRNDGLDDTTMTGRDKSSYQRKRADELSRANVVIVDLLHETYVMVLKSPENLFHNRRLCGSAGGPSQRHPRC
ncbi:hypothetical protein MRX96_058072 [Rhipicephalus microplus]